MKNLKKVFKGILLTCLLGLQTLSAQTTNPHNSIQGIDTNSLFNLCFEAFKKSKSSFVKQMSDSAVFRQYYYFGESLKDLSDKYKFYSAGLAITHHGDFKFVWDVDRKVFLDTIDLDNFNNIISSAKILLNSYEKVILYNLLVYQENPYHYQTHMIIRRKVVEFKVLYEKEFPINSLFKEQYLSRYFFKPILERNKTLKSIVSSSNELVFYLPYFNYPQYKSHDILPIEKVSFQVFYFNPEGHLVHTFWLYDYLEVINEK